MVERRGYGSPTAYRRALTDRLNNAAERSRWVLPQLQRQTAYDRLLQRLYRIDRGWVVKGAIALLARNIGVRATVDIDVYRGIAADSAERELRDAVARDIGDWFRFDVGPPRVGRNAVNGTRLPVAAYVGTTVWTRFHVDLVGPDGTMTGEPEDVPALIHTVMPGVAQHGYRVYPLVDHVADKTVATFERHGDSEVPSTRYKDLVDLVAIVTAVSVRAEPQMAALAAGAQRRRIALPQRFGVPARDLWERGYAAEAGRSLLSVGRTLDEALGVVGPFLDPLLDRTAVGVWDSERGAWVSGLCCGAGVAGDR